MVDCNTNLDGSPIPTRFQIERQLARMMESKLFMRKTSQAALLKGIVEIALNEGEVTEKRLREVVYGNRGALSLLRVQIGNLKETTGEYYSGLGQNDLIHIYLESWLESEKLRRQTGWNYMPTFAYNPRHELTRKYFAAYLKIGDGRLSLISQGLRMMAEIVEIDSHYADAWAAIGTGNCLKTKFVLHNDPEERGRALVEANGCIEIAIELAPNTWHPHAAKGFYLLLSDKIDEAASEFSIARHWNRPATDLYPGFGFFLQSANSAGLADWSRNMALEYFGEPLLLGLHGVTLIASGQLEEAEAHFREALELEPNNGMCHMAFSRLLDMLGRPKEAAWHFVRAEVLLGAENVAMWEAYGNSLSQENESA